MDNFFSKFADANTVYYFLSTFAQVWSALIVFAAVALRDKLATVESVMIQSFSDLKSIIEETRISWKTTYPHINDPNCLVSPEVLQVAFRNDLAAIRNIDTIQDRAFDISGPNSVGNMTVFVRGSEVKAKMKRAIILFERLENINPQKNGLKGNTKSFIVNSLVILLISLVSIYTSKIFALENYGQTLFLILVIGLLGYSFRVMGWFIKIWLS